jgi:factor associated with neutral sphingomyelinase activation
MGDENNMTLKWQNGLISNYDYLMYLNSCAGRTLNDVTQYVAV